MHLEKLGLAKKFLSCFASTLEDKARHGLGDRLKAFPMVPPWNNKLVRLNLTNVKPLTDRKVKMNATDAGRICCVLGLIVSGWLKESHFMPKEATLLRMRVGEHWLSHVMTVVFNVARSTSSILATHHHVAEWYGPELHLVVKAAREGCFQLWPAHFNNPTVHAGSHAPTQQVNQSGATNVRDGKGENKHHYMQFAMKNYNGKRSPEAHMMMVNNYRESALFLVHGGSIHLAPEKQPGPDYLRVIEGPVVRKLLGRSCSTRTYVGNEQDDDVNGLCTTLEVSSDSDSKSESADEDTLAEPQGGTHPLHVSVDMVEADLDEVLMTKMSIWM